MKRKQAAPADVSQRTPMLFPRFPFSLLLAVTSLPVASGPLWAGDFTPEQLHTFESKVRPLLAEHCYSCHGPQKQNNGLRLDSRAAILRGSDYGIVAEAGKPAESKLLKAIQHAEGVEAMPKKADKLPPEAIAVLTDWVQQGLPWPEEAAPTAAVENWRQHWAFQPVVMPPVPVVKAADRVRQPLDAHVLAGLEKAGLTLSPEADRATLARRASLDLTGLPPTFDQVQAFVSDPAPDAWPRLVDGLLGSPNFGERWARRWMDIARYADTKGYVFQEERRYAYAYTYRDWLVSAFNNDLPYDRFLILQLAADRVTDWEKQPQDLAAMGFLTLGRRFLNSEPDIIDDRLDVVFRGTQGLTVSCARCHDHKFDPIPTADYYSLYGVFASSTEPNDKPLIGQPDNSPEYRAYQAELAKKEEAVAAFRRLHPPEPRKPLPYLDLLTPYQEKPPFNRRHRNQLRDLVKEVEKYKATNPAAPPRAMVMVDKPQPVEPVIFLRGNQGRHGPQVPRRFLKALTPGTERPAFSQGSGRLEMAQSIASPQNPLTARVWVNRVWTYLTGTPLVDTPSDFGVRTARPDHPELLDQLAAQFMAEGWSTKKLIRSILLSSTWQQTSLTYPEAAAKDPENRLYWRQNRRRLDFEALRDSLLAVSGNLDRTPGGRGQEMVTGAGTSRRTLYGLVDRQNLPGLFRTFDFASPDATAPKRFETTVPQQALYMMNSPFVTAQAERLAGEKPTADGPETIRHLYRTVLSRDPAPDEIELSLACLHDLTVQPRQTGTAWQNGWGGFDPATLTTTFTPFPHYQENRWSPSATVPAPALGYVNLTREGGHPGSTSAQSAIRRWVAPGDAKVELTGTVSLPSDQSTGITAYIVHSRLGLLGTWPIPPTGKVDATISGLDLKAGDILDFILDCQGSPNSDSFSWAPVIRDTTSHLALADATKDFGGPGASALAAYAQVLLCSNEFLYLD
jgi:cytochrome c553